MLKQDNSTCPDVEEKETVTHVTFSDLTKHLHGKNTEYLYKMTITES